MVHTYESYDGCPFFWGGGGRVHLVFPPSLPHAADLPPNPTGGKAASPPSSTASPPPSSSAASSPRPPRPPTRPSAPRSPRNPSSAAASPLRTTTKSPLSSWTPSACSCAGRSPGPSSAWRRRARRRPAPAALCSPAVLVLLVQRWWGGRGKGRRSRAAGARPRRWTPFSRGRVRGS